MLNPMKRIDLCLPLLVIVQMVTMNAGWAADPPNFVVILTDDQSWVGSSLQMLPNDPLSKSDYYRTPNIERLAGMGMRFSQAYAPAASCSPSRRSLLVGQNPARHIYSRDVDNWTRNYREQLSIPRMLKAANPSYRSAHFGKWDMRFDEVTPEEMGYDISDGVTGNNSAYGKRDAYLATDNADPKLLFSVTERAGNFMAGQAKSGHPFYLQVSYYAVHLGISYRASTLQEVTAWPKGSKHAAPEFAAMTNDMDTAIGLLLDRIEALGLRNSTYVLFLSDNGGRAVVPDGKRKLNKQNFPLRSGKHSFYEGGIRVPFVVAGPGIGSNVTSTVPVTGLDILPTVADLAGYPGKLPDTVDGGSIKPLLLQGGSGQVVRRKPFLLFHQSIDRLAQSALLLDNFKLIKTWPTNKTELFDLSRDIGETNDLSRALPDKTAELNTLLEGYLSDVGAEIRGRDTLQIRRTGAASADD
jgi:arylsulfatase A